jgi:hypothetical protein
MGRPENCRGERLPRDTHTLPNPKFKPCAVLLFPGCVTVVPGVLVLPGYAECFVCNKLITIFVKSFSPKRRDNFKPVQTFLSGVYYYIPVFLTAL